MYPERALAATDWRAYAPVLADDRRLVREGFDWLTAGERELLLGENARNPVRLRLRAQPRLQCRQCRVSVAVPSRVPYTW